MCWRVRAVAAGCGCSPHRAGFPRGADSHAPWPVDRGARPSSATCTSDGARCRIPLGGRRRASGIAQSSPLFARRTHVPRESPCYARGTIDGMNGVSWRLRPRLLTDPRIMRRCRPQPRAARTQDCRRCLNRSTPVREALAGSAPAPGNPGLPTTPSRRLPRSKRTRSQPPPSPRERDEPRHSSVGSGSSSATIGSDAAASG